MGKESPVISSEESEQREPLSVWTLRANTMLVGNIERCALGQKLQKSTWWLLSHKEPQQMAFLRKVFPAGLVDDYDTVMYGLLIYWRRPECFRQWLLRIRNFCLQCACSSQWRQGDWFCSWSVRGWTLFEVILSPFH